MQYKVRDIDQHGLDIHQPITAEWIGAEVPGLEARPAPSGLTLAGRIERSGENFLLRGDVKGKMRTTCGRCLEVAEVELDLPIAVSFVERDDAELTDEDDDSGDVVPFVGGVIDIGPTIRDEIVLALPIGPICRPDCAGICPVCGGNRNAKPCTCEDDRRKAQSKFAALSKVKL